ncbi:hypothetical protein NQ317_016429 [Molorchus minor]|uniref:Uncharacterized protein n=1 Tax=Molorchus minor TaxID=1323400 RepID=A0ABQ9JXW4_9CUCU|nr:hypothetical protein NQ317_016429 [Molorchus minor]
MEYGYDALNKVQEMPTSKEHQARNQRQGQEHGPEHSEEHGHTVTHQEHSHENGQEQVQIESVHIEKQILDNVNRTYAAINELQEKFTAELKAALKAVVTDVEDVHQSLNRDQKGMIAPFEKCAGRKDAMECFNRAMKKKMENK